MLACVNPLHLQESQEGVYIQWLTDWSSAQCHFSYQTNPRIQNRTFGYVVRSWGKSPLDNSTGNCRNQEMNRMSTSQIAFQGVIGKLWGRRFQLNSHDCLLDFSYSFSTLPPPPWSSFDHFRPACHFFNLTHNRCPEPLHVDRKTF